MAGHRAANGWWRPFPMATGRQPRSLPPCVTTGSPRPAFSMARSTAQASLPGSSKPWSRPCPRATSSSWTTSPPTRSPAYTRPLRRSRNTALPAALQPRSQSGLASQKWRAPTETGGVPWDEESGLRRSSSARRCAMALSSRPGRSRDLGVGLSSLTRWIGQFRDEEMPPEIKDDLQAELKRLRKENAVLRQERDILKKAAAFFAKEGSR